MADAANRERESGQAALFGGDDHAEAGAAPRAKPTDGSRAEQMATERENFGFYFAAHPVEQYRAIASANGARSLRLADGRRRARRAGGRPR